MSKELFHCQTNVPGNFPQQCRRNVSAGVEGYRGSTAIGMPILTVGSALANFLEANLH
jgi:hypothetical protein